MTPAQLCQIERERVSPTLKTLERIATALGMTVVELLGGKGAESDKEKTVPRMTLPDDYITLRVREPDAAKALAAILSREKEIDAVEDMRGIPSACNIVLNYSRAKLDGAGAVLAEEVRVALGAGTVPFCDLPSCLEFRGVRIYKIRLPKVTKSVSFWNRSRESLIIVLNEANTAERDLYRLSYEIGSACLFVSSGNSAFDENIWEHRFLTDFAKAFLMPAVMVRQYVAETGIDRSDWTLSALCKLKVRFGVSAESFALRLEELGLIAPTIRLKLRDMLHKYYKKNSRCMEPSPNLSPLTLGTRNSILLEQAGQRGKTK